MNDENKQRIEDELIALESIYDERCFVRSQDGGQISVYVELPPELKITYSTAKNEAIADEGEIVLQLKYLPPIVLHFTLPPTYPSTTLPHYTLSCKWLTTAQISRLCDEIDSLWNNEMGGEVLFEWMQVLTEDTWKILQIDDLLCLAVSSDSERTEKRAVQDTKNMDSLVTCLIDYNTKEIDRVFKTTYHECAVCFLEKPGAKCVSFPKCNHVFCSECIAAFFSVQIKDGSVRALTCPTEKCLVQADPGLVKRLVTPELYEKYESFLLQSTLDCMDDIAYCPRRTCNAVVLKDGNMGQCEVCNFVFCVLCKRTYHGVEKCPITSKEVLKLRESYLNGTEEVKVAMEKRYGKERLKRLVEEHFSEKWMELNSKKCPQCSTAIEKIDGCNKMTCNKCGKHFCWLCGKGLSSADPYEHFNKPTGCFNRLFEDVEEDFEAFDEFSDSEDEDFDMGYVYAVN